MSNKDIALALTAALVIGMFFMPPTWVGISMMALVLAWGLYLVEIGGPSGTL